MKSNKKQKKKCEANTPFCSGELLARYGVNGSEREGKDFVLCGPCRVFLKRGGHKLKLL
jgi:hypothetical protein